MSLSPPAVGSPPATSGARPSWVAWTALALSAATLLLTMALGIVYAVDRISGGSSSAFADEEGPYYDAGMPSWGQVVLSPTGQATERALTDSVEEALRQGFEDFDNDPDELEDVYCAALPAPKKDTVATCSVTAVGVDSTVVLVFTDDDGGYLTTLY